MLGIIIGGFVLVGAMFVVGRHEADASLPKGLMIAAGVSVTMAILSIFLGFLALPIGFALVMWAVHQFCYLGWGKSAAVAGIYFVTMILFEVGWTMLMGS